MPRDQFNEPITREITLADGTTKVLQPLSNVLVTVYKMNADGTRQANPATIYASRGPSDATVFPGGNPFVTPAGGKTGFWADPGDYDVVLHDQNLPARIGDQSFGWQANSGADQGIKLNQLPEFGRALAPAGALLGYAGVGDPPGWLLCDGRVLPTVGAYAALYAAIGPAYGLGNEGAGNFRIPDYRGRSLIGPDDMGTATGAAARLPSLVLASRARGKSGGEDWTLLGANHLPVHGHRLIVNSNGTAISINSGGDHAHHVAVNQGNTPSGIELALNSIDANPNGGQAWRPTSTDGAHSHGITDNGHAHTGTVDDTGQTRGDRHNNLHPYQISNVIIKI